MRVVNLTVGGLSGYSPPHSSRRLYMRFSNAVYKKINSVHIWSWGKKSKSIGLPLGAKFLGYFRTNLF